MDHVDFGRLAQIDLLKHENHILEPGLLQKIEKLPVRLRPGIGDREDKQNDVGARHKVFRDHLMFLYHRIRPRRVHDVEIAQERNRQVALGQF